MTTQIYEHFCQSAVDPSMIYLVMFFCCQYSCYFSILSNCCTENHVLCSSYRESPPQTDLSPQMKTYLCLHYFYSTGLAFDKVSQQIGADQYYLLTTSRSFLSEVPEQNHFTNNKQFLVPMIYIWRNSLKIEPKKHYNKNTSTYTIL